MEYYLTMRKKRNPVICDHVDESWGHYEVSHKERQTLYDIIYTWNPKKSNSEKHRREEHRVGGHWRWEKWNIVKGYKLQL